MPNETPFVNIDLSFEYQRNLRDLAKKYRNIRSDTLLIITEIQKGNFIGDRISGLGEDYSDQEDITANEIINIIAEF